ncbi:MAG TPA: DnaA N-terminal domain-containing protein, partial [Actinomycetota bacterium]|nr:DnaA N-terminal domain-containing protein [Actinomycetota bacterium]
MDAKQVWRAALGELQVSLSPANYETWLRDTQLVDVDEQRFKIAVPNGFSKDWLETRYRSLISQTLARIVGYSVQVEFIVGPAPESAAPTDDATATGTSADRSAGQHVRVEPTRVGGEGGATNLNPRYTFANFIVGS